MGIAHWVLEKFLKENLFIEVTNEKIFILFNAFKYFGW